MAKVMRDVPGVAQDMEYVGSTGSLRRSLLTQPIGSRAIWSVRSPSAREVIETGRGLRRLLRVFEWVVVSGPSDIELEWLVLGLVVSGISTQNTR